MPPQNEKITVLGLGYVGCVTAACLAELGHNVVGVDRDPHKVQSVMNGHAPFYEPGLEEIVARNLAAGRLWATTPTAEAVREAGIIFLCVGTPSLDNGNLSMEQLRRTGDELAPLLAGRAEPLIVVVRSTVFPGTCEQVVTKALPGATVVANPEFLREGSAVRDFLEPTLAVVGGDDRAAMERVADLYRPLGIEPACVSLRSAEMIKYVCNAFHAVKISFANEIGALCARLAVPAQEVMDTFFLDTKLNISTAYLKPGFAFGGSCLPKDLRALNYRSLRLDLKLPLLESVLTSNARHLDRAIEAVLDLPAQRIGIFGLAFKENTDDVRESPVVLMMEQLLGKGRQLRAWDPHVRLDQIYGSNQSFLLATIPHITGLLVGSLDDLLRWTDHLVVLQKPAPAIAERIQRSGVPVLDMVGAFRQTEQAVTVA